LIELQQSVTRSLDGLVIEKLHPCIELVFEVAPKIRPPGR
jgi:hypothetical protein